MPDFYYVFQAAERCNTQPWRLVGLEDPPAAIWSQWALLILAAEAQASKPQAGAEQEVADVSGILAAHEARKQAQEVATEAGV